MNRDIAEDIDMKADNSIWLRCSVNLFILCDREGT